MSENTPRTTPTAAEVVRSACSRAAEASLAIEGTEPVATSVQHLRDNGLMYLAVPDDSPAAALALLGVTSGTPAMLELADTAPLALRERVRVLVWMQGMLHAVPEHEIAGIVDTLAAEDPCETLLDIGHSAVLLRFELTAVVVADAQGAEPVPLTDLVAARPDPFCSFETGWLQHLELDHADLVAAMTRRLPPRLRQGNIRPLGVDRYGIRLRVERDDEDGTPRDADVRLAFAHPVDDVMALSRAIRILAGCPFLNGLRTR